MFWESDVLETDRTEPGASLMTPKVAYWIKALLMVAPCAVGFTTTPYQLPLVFTVDRRVMGEAVVPEADRVPKTLALVREHVEAERTAP